MTAIKLFRSQGSSVFTSIFLLKCYGLALPYENFAPLPSKIPTLTSPIVPQLGLRDVMIDDPPAELTWSDFPVHLAWRWRWQEVPAGIFLNVGGFASNFENVSYAKAKLQWYTIWTARYWRQTLEPWLLNNLIAFIWWKIYCPVGVLSWTCRSERKWQSR